MWIRRRRGHGGQKGRGEGGARLGWWWGKGGMLGNDSGTSVDIFVDYIQLNLIR